MMAIELIPSHSLFCLARIIKLFLTVLKIQANSQLELQTKIEQIQILSMKYEICNTLVEIELMMH